MKDFIYLIDRDHIDGLMQKRRNSTAYALELRHFCIKPLTSNGHLN